MLRSLSKIPAYAYLTAGVIGVTATYLFYTPSTSKKKSKNANLNGYPRGLINYKNECYINVILQSLASSNKVTDWLFNRTKQKTTVTGTPSFNLFETLSGIISKINRFRNDENDLPSDDDDELEFYAAQNLKRALNIHNWQIQSEEHDCHELFHLLMDVLDVEQQENKISLSSLNYFQPSSSALKENSRLAKNPFHGYLATQLICLDCNYKYAVRLESFYSLSLTIPQLQMKNSKISSNLIDFLSNTNSGVSLFECLNNYFKPELIKEMKCENCGPSTTDQSESKISFVNKKGFIKKQVISKLPECLCIQIQRNSWSDSSYEMIKKTNYVQFPLTINIDSANSTCALNSNAFSFRQVGLGGLIGGRALLNNSTDKTWNSSSPTSPTRSNQNSKYELRSAVVHYGNAHSGHFVCYRKPLANRNNNDTLNDNMWLQISDNDIKKVNKANFLNSNIYMLFYDKC